MPLVIDSSSPAAHSVLPGTQLNTSAAFTPPADPLLLLMWAGDSQGGVTPSNPPVISSSPSQTWTQDAYDNRNSGLPTDTDGQAGIWHAVVSGSPGSSTVSANNTGAVAAGADSILKLLVLTGHDPAAPTGAAGGGRQASGSSVSQSYTGTITGGQGFLVLCDWSALATATWTPAAGCTLLDTGTISGGISYGLVQRTDPDGVLGATTTVGIAGLLTGGKYHWAYAEVISLEAAQAGRYGTGGRGQQQSVPQSNW